MKSLFTSFVMGLALASHAQTQQWGQVYFDNSVFTPARLVRVSDGVTPLVGTNFIAELLYGTSPSTLVSLTNAPPARFRPEGTMYPGTWSGGMRTLVGIPPGTQTYIRVDVWNNDVVATYDEAVRNGFVWIWSTIFTYVPPPSGSSTEAHSISNFSQFETFSLPCWGSPFQPPSILVQPTNRTVKVGDTLVLEVVSTNVCSHQWQVNGTNITVLPPGSRFLLLTNVQPSQAGDYRVIVKGSFRGITSQVARLTVEPPPQWGEVNFANNVFTPQRLISFFGGGLTGTNFLAQLLYGANQFNLIPVTNSPAPFRRLNTSQPGTWNGGRRTLVGIPPGTTVVMQVVVWDCNYSGSYEETLAANAFLGRSPTFTYTPPLPGSPLQSYDMANFTAFIMHCGPWFGPPGILEQPTNQVAYIGQNVTLSIVRTNACMTEWQFNGTNLSLVNSWKLRIGNVRPHHEGDYRAIVRAFFGTNQLAVTSQVARLTVHPPPQFVSPRYDDGAFAFQVSEDTGRTVTIETAPDLNPATPWTPVFTNTAPFSFTNSTPADRQRFYRTVIR